MSTVSGKRNLSGTGGECNGVPSGVGAEGELAEHACRVVQAPKRHLAAGVVPQHPSATAAAAQPGYGPNVFWVNAPVEVLSFHSEAVPSVLVQRMCVVLSVPTLTLLAVQPE